MLLFFLHPISAHPAGLFLVVFLVFPFIFRLRYPPYGSFSLEREKIPRTINLIMWIRLIEAACSTVLQAPQNQYKGSDIARKVDKKHFYQA